MTTLDLRGGRLPVIVDQGTWGHQFSFTTSGPAGLTVTGAIVGGGATVDLAVDAEEDAGTYTVEVAVPIEAADLARGRYTYRVTGDGDAGSPVFLRGDWVVD